MKEYETTLILGVCWALLVMFSSLMGIYRSLVDRIRNGLSSLPGKEGRIHNLLSDALELPNHERPLHSEAALLSSLQVLTGFIVLNTFASSLVQQLLFVIFSIVVERISSWLYPRKISQSRFLTLHLSLGFIPVWVVRIFSWPIRFFLSSIENLVQSTDQKHIQEQEEDSEIADHIRMVGREGSNLDPEILEILGNTMEMSHLKIKDVMIPRNQVQILDVGDTVEKNLEITKSCGHTRLPLCEGNLDHCLGIVHAKYAFRSILEENDDFDFKNITKLPAMLNGEELLPVALKRMMKLKVHMALVRDEFGGIDGVITLEDILEEVVGEIQDEFDADEEEVQNIREGEWKISGLTPLHELPEELGIKDQEELTSLGGMITREIGKIPQKGETFDFPLFKLEILDADETKVLSVKIKLKEESAQNS